MLILLALGAPMSWAENFQGIDYLDTLGSLRSKFPGAVFQQLHPAWARPEDVMYKLTGTGISGAIILKFYDHRPTYRAMAEEARTRLTIPAGAHMTDSSSAESLATQISTAQHWVTHSEEMASEPDDSIEVEWVRWVPDTPIPLGRYVAKYGPAEKSGYADEDMAPYRQWMTRGVLVELTNDEKSVGRVDFTFTRADMREACRKRGIPIPAYLRSLPIQKAHEPRK